jgi:AcrR family transcriptional regulator
MRTQRQRSEATTRKLLAAARRRFAADGYAATSLDDVVGAAGMTKGALYHHFDGKRELFRAVFEREHERLAHAAAAAAAEEADAVEAFFAGARRFFEDALDPEVARIALLDGPSALGWDEMRAVELRHSLALIKTGLERGIADGRIAERPVEPLAHMLFGSLCEGATLVARSEDPDRTARHVLAELRAQLDALERQPTRTLGPASPEKITR